MIYKQTKEQVFKSGEPSKMQSADGPDRRVTVPKSFIKSAVVYGRPRDLKAFCISMPTTVAIFASNLLSIFAMNFLSAFSTQTSTFLRVWSPILSIKVSKLISAETGLEMDTLLILVGLTVIHGAKVKKFVVHIAELLKFKKKARVCGAWLGGNGVYVCCRLWRMTSLKISKLLPFLHFGLLEDMSPANMNQGMTKVTCAKAGFYHQLRRSECLYKFAEMACADGLTEEAEEFIPAHGELRLVGDSA
jgi:hypothetical protein